MKYIFIGLIFLTQFAWAREISVQLTVNTNDITMEDQVELEVQVSGTQSAPEPSLSGSENFTVEGAGSSSQIQIINGVTSVTKTFQYMLLPKKEGTFTVGPAIVTIDGKEYKSESATIKVAKGATNNSATTQGKESKNYFIESVVDKSSPYVNEQFVYTFRLYTRASIDNASLSFPEFKDFWKEKIGDQRKYERTINGIAWQVVEISYLLTGLKPGKATIEEARLIGEVIVEGTRPRNRHSVFDQFFGGGGFGERKRVQLVAKPVIVDVKSLPEPKPHNFSGIVGDFSLESSVDKKTVKKGESVTLTVVLKGSGNLDNITLPLPETNEYKVYEDKPSLEKKEENHGVIAVKTFKRALVPQTEGTLTLAPIKLTIFDPTAKSYRTLETSSLILEVAAGDKDDIHHTVSGATVDTKKSVEVLGHDLMPIRYSLESLNSGPISPIKKTVLIFIILLLPVLYSALAINRKRKLALTNNNSGYLRKSKAAKEFSNKYKVVETSGQFIQDTSNLFKDYLGNKLNIDGRAITQVDLDRVLAPHKIDPKIVNEIKELFDVMERAQYGGGELSDGTKKDILMKIKSLFEALEKEMK